MRLANETAAIAFRVLNKCTDELSLEGAWRWSCFVQNGTRLPIAASLEEGFLHLACHPEGIRKSVCTLEQALFGNRMLSGGVKVALGKANHDLHLATDIAILEEKQLLDRFHGALEGFHDGYRLFRAPTSLIKSTAAKTGSGVALGELLREASWPSTERGPNEFTAELDTTSASHAGIRNTEYGVELNSELVRSNATAEISRQALTLFLLTATSALRLVRAYSEETDGGVTFGLQVILSCDPAIEEIDHALAALSIAHRMCARETTVLLYEATARCYLAARNLPTTNDHHSEQEN